MLCIIGDTLITPVLNDRILPGITRKTIIQIVKDNPDGSLKDIKEVQERPLSVKEVVEAYENGTLKEFF
ncbi:MAG: aminotransferase class IV [Solitalea-like symbiont of Acarus siro]